MKKTITIELPDGLPDGWECVGYGAPQQGDMFYEGTMWELVFKGRTYTSQYLIARRTETLPDWANKQPSFQWLAKMRGSRHTTLMHEVGKTWGMHGMERDVLMVDLEHPPIFKPNPMRLINGKWTNA